MLVRNRQYFADTKTQNKTESKTKSKIKSKISSNLAELYRGDRIRQKIRLANTCSSNVFGEILSNTTVKLHIEYVKKCPT